MSDIGFDAIRNGLSKTIAASGPITDETLAAATQSVLGQLQMALTPDVLLDDSVLDMIEEACGTASESPWGYIGYTLDETEMFEEDHVDLPWCAVVPMVKPSPDERPEPDTFHETDLGQVISGEPIAIFPPREVDEFIADTQNEDPWENPGGLERLSNFSNARFVAVARTAVPYLVREVKALRALLSDA